MNRSHRGLAITLAMLIGAITVISLIAVGLHTALTQWGQQGRTFRSSAAVVREMRSLQRLETASYSIEKIIEAGTQGNVFQDILYGDRILLIAHGEVTAGFDLSELAEDDVQVRGSSLTLRLPPPQILHVSLDSDQTRIYDRQLGLLSRGDKDLEAEARRQAEIEIRDAACSQGILDHASASATRQLKTLFTAAGFESVTVEVPAADCP